MQQNRGISVNKGQSNSLEMGIPKESIGSSMCTRQKDLDSLCSLKLAAKIPKLVCVKKEIKNRK